MDSVNHFSRNMCRHTIPTTSKAFNLPKRSPSTAQPPARYRHTTTPTEPPASVQDTKPSIRSFPPPPARTRVYLTSPEGATKQLFEPWYQDHREHDCPGPIARERRILRREANFAGADPQAVHWAMCVLEDEDLVAPIHIASSRGKEKNTKRGSVCGKRLGRNMAKGAAVRANLRGKRRKGEPGFEMMN
jgi:hypothetical protein